MTDRSIEAAQAADIASQAGARPYGWIGLALSPFAIIILAILVWVAVALLAFAVEMPFAGWQHSWASLMAAYQAGKQGEVGGLFVVLLIGPWPQFEPAIENGLVCLLQLALAAAVAILARFRGGPRWRDLIAWRPWRWRDNARWFGILLGVAVASNVAISSLTNYFEPGPSEAPPSFDVPFALSVLGNIVLAAIFEELIVRGWLYTGLRAKLSAWPTIVITAALFALLHAMSSLQDILPTLPLGLAAGYLRERTGSVKAPIALHLFHNVIAFALALL